MKYLIGLFAMAILGFSTPSYAQQNTTLANQDFLDATVISVAPRKRTITYRVRGIDERQQVAVPEGVRITVNGRQARLRDVRRGDNIQLLTKMIANRTVVERIRVPETPVTLEQRRADPIVEQAAPVMLPKTASTWPTVLMFGVVALIGAAILRRRRTIS